ncbi:M6 metalloprotease [Corynespora cassiicola Philippines]|uniref:M6 metalloprotease n=1 Tax=Corynespora cassiicola Philippines TaxID=1448308 RepID=A0A2T2NSP3_CORCC|nr:M6 metalloprotease [Corynespora cassiicola Philippines]
MAPHHCNGPCFVPPHPDLLAKKKATTLKVQGGANAQPLGAQPQTIPGEKRLPGMNDGTIFPQSHYREPTSIMKMGNAALERTPLRNDIKIVVVLAEFQDVKMASGTKQRMKDLFFSSGKIPTGSVTEYYKEVSNNLISISGEVVGPFTLNQTMGYYANNNYGYSDLEPNSRTMANEALTAAIGSTSFKQYDNDGNGYVDAFVVVHAGGAAEVSGKSSDIWSVKWVLPQERDVGGVKVYGFLTVPEDAKLGVCAHEIGHLVFGWPDLYDTDYSSGGVGSWCLMSAGSWGGGGDRPVHPSAWCKLNQGWVDGVTETENHQVTLRDVKTGFKTHRLWTNGDRNSQEYFLIENRLLTGYDENLPGAGLLVWHIDDSVPGNTDEFHPKVKIVQADGLDQLSAKGNNGDAGDCFPGITNNSTFNTTSSPNSRSYSGGDTFVSITNIPKAAESITFNVTVRPITQPSTGPFDSKKWYRIKNTYNPSTFSLDVINDAGSNSRGLLQMARDGNFSGQFWQIKSNGDGTYHIRSLFLGQNRQLDVYGNDKTQPVLQTAGNFSGQYWVIKPWGDGTWHLENAYSGPFMYLDTMQGGPTVAMNASNAGRPTQRWTITPIRDITEANWEKSKL